MGERGSGTEDGETQSSSCLLLVVVVVVAMEVFLSALQDRTLAGTDKETEGRNNGIADNANIICRPQRKRSGHT